MVVAVAEELGVGPSMQEHAEEIRRILRLPTPQDGYSRLVGDVECELAGSPEYDDTMLELVVEEVLGSEFLLNVKTLLELEVMLAIVVLLEADLPELDVSLELEIFMLEVLLRLELTASCFTLRASKLAAKFADERVVEAVVHGGTTLTHTVSLIEHFY